MGQHIASDHDRVLRDFLEVPEVVYAGDPRYVPEPDYWVRRLVSVRANPFFRAAECELVVVECGHRPSARASLVFPRENSGEAFFGFVETTRDQQVVARLIEELEQRCRRRGVRRLVGPFSPNTSGVTGFQMDAFDTPRVFFEAYNPRYYSEMFLAAGFTVVKTGRAWKGSVPPRSGESPPTRSGPYRIRMLKAGRMREAIGAIASVFDLAFTRNWYSRPLARSEYRYMAWSLLPAFNRRLIQWVELDGRPIGAAILLLDINEILGRRPPASLLGTLCRVRRRCRRIAGVTVLAVGMVPEHRHSRGGHMLYDHLMHTLAPYRTLTTTWITEGNGPSEAIAGHLGMRPYKSFAVLEKRL